MLRIRMRPLPELSYRPEELAALLEDHFTVDETRPVVTFEHRSGRVTGVTVDFPVPCEPKSQTAFQLSLPEALLACRAARTGGTGSRN